MPDRIAAMLLSLSPLALGAADCDAPPIMVGICGCPYPGEAVGIGETLTLVSFVSQGWVEVEELRSLWSIAGDADADLAYLGDMVLLTPVSAGHMEITLTGVATGVGCGIPTCPDPYVASDVCSFEIVAPG